MNSTGLQLYHAQTESSHCQCSIVVTCNIDIMPSISRFYRTQIKKYRAHKQEGYYCIDGSLVFLHLFMTITSKLFSYHLSANVFVTYTSISFWSLWDIQCPKTNHGLWSLPFLWVGELRQPMLPLLELNFRNQDEGCTCWQNRLYYHKATVEIVVFGVFHVIKHSCLYLYFVSNIAFLKLFCH